MYPDILHTGKKVRLHIPIQGRKIVPEFGSTLNLGR